MSDTEIKKELEKQDEEKQKKELANEKIQDLEQVKQDIISYQNGGELNINYFEKICKLCKIECKVPKNVSKVRYNGYTFSGNARRNRKIGIVFDNARKTLKDYNINVLV